jgi:amino acid adenylation domain-containing protein
MLRKEGVQEETVVGISAGQGFDRFIGILGIIKAGGAFLPIDGDFPAERKEYMLKDSGAKVLLVEANQKQDLDFNGKIIDIMEKPYETEEKSNLDIHLNARNLVYIMYTSGSTGNPKGVMVEHQNVVRLVKETNYVQFEKTDRMLQGSTIVFDASTFEIWGALLNGLELHLIDKQLMLDAVRLEEKLAHDQITIMWMTAPLFNQISKNNPAMFQGLRYLLVGGEALSLDPIERVRVACPGLKILNGYGPTENTTFSTTHLIDRNYAKIIPIGKPIANSRVYIMDADLELRPIGAAGEIYVGGDGVSRGYINNDSLHKQKFINSPFVSGERLYRTGDIGRWLPDRIEIGEIEHVLDTHPHVKEAVVLVRERAGEDKYISAYVVLNEDEQDDIHTVKDYVRKKLPDYMQPSFIIPVDEIPLTINGKVDQAALLKKEMENKTPDTEEPANEIEEKLLQIWQITLKNEHIGVDDNFFDVGGNSILLVSMYEKLLENFQTEIEIADIFANPTISRLAEFIEELA